MRLERNAAQRHICRHPDLFEEAYYIPAPRERLLRMFKIGGAAAGARGQRIPVKVRFDNYDPLFMPRVGATASVIIRLD